MDCLVSAGAANIIIGLFVIAEASNYYLLFFSPNGLCHQTITVVSGQGVLCLIASLRCDFGKSGCSSNRFLKLPNKHIYICIYFLYSFR